MVSNVDIANHLQQISFLFSKAKEPWKSKAFSTVAEMLYGRAEPLKIENGILLEKIPGVGKAIKEVIEQFVTTGTSEKIKKLIDMLPDEDFERFDASVCKRKVTQLLKPLSEAGIDWGFAGSMRRGLKTVKDVDVIVCLHDEEKERAIVQQTIENAGLKADVRNGQEKIGVSIPIHSQGRSFVLDLNFTTPNERGAMYLYFTGPKVFNIKQRSKAKRMGLRLNQKGLFDSDGNCIASKTEEEIFDALNWKYLEPKDRS